MLEPFVKIDAQARDVGQFDVVVETPLLNRVSGLPDALERIMSVPNVQDLIDANLLTRLRDHIDRNLIVASGGNLADPRSYSKSPVLPSKSAIKDPTALAEAYLGGTPLLDFLNQLTAFAIPTKTRFEHMTQTYLRSLGVEDLRDSVRFLSLENLSPDCRRE